MPCSPPASRAARASSALALRGVRAVHALRRLCGRRAVRRDRGRRRPRHAGGDHRLRAAGLDADDVAGDGIGDARLLRALRPRPDPVLAGHRAARVRGAHRDHRVIDHGDGGAAGRALHQRAGLARRRALARRLWRGARGRRDRGGAVGRADRRAVPHHRAEAHAACRADRRRGDRRHLRHRHADGGDPVLRHDLAARVPAVRSAGGGGARRSTAWSGGRRARSWATAPRSLPVVDRRLRRAGGVDRCVLRRGSASTPSPPPASRTAACSQRAARAFRAASPKQRAAAQGMDAAAPRPLAGVADADAAPLSAAAGAVAVAGVRHAAPTTSCCWCPCW